jgi:N-sulfoglucosamine sulfohydrolase
MLPICHRLAWVLLCGCLCRIAVAADRPNILWITAEDLSPNLGCYGDADARTPHLDAFARDAVRYTRAFATAPVCSPARSCLISGVYATTLGTQRLRSQFPVPSSVRGFPAYLREAGYYCANNVKTDYNLRNEAAFIRDAWDDSSPQAHWRGRRPGQPFFAVFNIMATHQSFSSASARDEFESEVRSRLPPDQRHTPERVSPPPFYPEGPEAQSAWARYHDCITFMDREAGRILQELAADGLADNTIVFFFGDHGMGMPLGKRCLFDSGLRVPLLIRFPARHRALAPADPGATTERLVSFVDFAPTVLALANVQPLPRQHGFQGQVFLGKDPAPPRQYVFGARDRVDEAFDVARSVRDGQWLYIRNFMPHLPWLQPERYSDQSPFRRALAERVSHFNRWLAGADTHDTAKRPREELYDTRTDPYQLRNLAREPGHQAELDRLRGALREWIQETKDVGFLAESDAWTRLEGRTSLREFGADPKVYPLVSILEMAGLVGESEAIPRQVQALGHTDAAVRYWAAVGLRAAGRSALTTARAALSKALDDPVPSVRIEAAGALAAAEPEATNAWATLRGALRHAQPEAILQATRTLELLGPEAKRCAADLRAVLDTARSEEQFGNIWMFIRFSAEATLERLR